MPGYECPDCRGDLDDYVATSVWVITFSTLTTTAAGLNTSTFGISVILDDDSEHEDSLPSVTGVVDDDRTIYTWTLTSPGIAVSGVLQVEHSTLGVLEQELEVSLHSGGT